MMENLIHRYLKRGMRIVLVNPTRVYGPGLLSVPNAATKIVKAYMEGKWRIIPGDGSRVGNYAFIDDIVNGHILAINSEMGEKISSQLGRIE
jgi:nucleoside-diphosphate-sugar epimerase